MQSWKMVTFTNGNGDKPAGSPVLPGIVRPVERISNRIRDRRLTIVRNFEPQVRPRSERLLVAIPAAVLLTLALNVVTFLVLHGSAPRVNEGNRQIIALPWAPYAVGAHVVPPVLTYVITCFFWRSSRHRILIAVVAGITE